MTVYVGGLRKRLIRDSVYAWTRQRLANLGWFDAGRQHKPITFVDEPADVSEQIDPNTLALSTETDRQTGLELGSNLSEFRWSMYIDFFAENDALGTHVIGDVAAILAGRMASIGAVGPVVPVFDFTTGAADPPEVFVVQVENIREDKAHDWPHSWLKHWQTCSFEIVDEYGDEGAHTWADLAGRTWSDLAGVTWEELG